MIEYLQEHILLAYRNSIIYIDLARYNIGGDDLSKIPAEYRTKDSHFFKIDVLEEDVSVLDLLRKYKMICI